MIAKRNSRTLRRVARWTLIVLLVALLAPALWPFFPVLAVFIAPLAAA